MAVVSRHSKIAAPIRRRVKRPLFGTRVSVISFFLLLRFFIEWKEPPFMAVRKLRLFMLNNSASPVQQLTWVCTWTADIRQRKAVIGDAMEPMGTRTRVTQRSVDVAESCVSVRGGIVLPYCCLLCGQPVRNTEACSAHRFSTCSVGQSRIH